VSTPICPRAISTHKLLLITSTSRLDGNEVLVNYADGTAAIYDAEELEKLRPAPKQTLAAWPSRDQVRGPLNP
jgi:hypothetical protein